MFSQAWSGSTGIVSTGKKEGDESLTSKALCNLHDSLRTESAFGIFKRSAEFQSEIG
jgi:hypothetical protein